MFRQFTVGGELAAESRQQRRLTVLIVNIEGIVAGNRLRRVGFIVAQRTHAGVSPDDIVARQRLFKVRVVDVQQVVDLFIIDRHLFWIAVVLDVGGTDN